MSELEKVTEVDDTDENLTMKRESEGNSMHIYYYTDTVGVWWEGNREVADAEAARVNDEPPGFNAVAVVGLYGVVGLLGE
jgi:hypothetical protein